METIMLKDNWTLTVLGKNVYDIPEKPIETKVPSTVYGTLLEKGLMPDPFFVIMNFRLRSLWRTILCMKQSLP